MKMTVCNRCGCSEKESDFEGMDVQIYDQEGSGSAEDAFTLCDPCIGALRVWIVSPPSVPTSGDRKL